MPEQIPKNGDQNTPTEPKQEEREQIEILDIASFQVAVVEGHLAEAAAWLEVAKADPKHDARWLDHRSREIMQALCNAGRIDEAEKYVDYAQDTEGRLNRRAKIDRLRGQAS